MSSLRNDREAHFALQQKPTPNYTPRRKVIIKRRRSFLGFTWFVNKEITL